MPATGEREPNFHLLRVRFEIVQGGVHPTCENFRAGLAFETLNPVVPPIAHGKFKLPKPMSPPRPVNLELSTIYLGSTIFSGSLKDQSIAQTSSPFKIRRI